VLLLLKLGAAVKGLPALVARGQRKERRWPVAAAPGVAARRVASRRGADAAVALQAGAAADHCAWREVPRSVAAQGVSSLRGQAAERRR
jgi:hypothetical protein